MKQEHKTKEVNAVEGLRNGSFLRKCVSNKEGIK